MQQVASLSGGKKEASTLAEQGLVSSESQEGEHIPINEDEVVSTSR